MRYLHAMGQIGISGERNDLQRDLVTLAHKLLQSSKNHPSQTSQESHEMGSRCHCKQLWTTVIVDLFSTLLVRMAGPMQRLFLQQQ